MNGKLLLKLIEEALNQNVVQVKMLANLLGSELRDQSPEISKKISTLTKPSGLRRGYTSGKLDTVSEITGAHDLLALNPVERLERAPHLVKAVEDSIEQVFLEHKFREKLRSEGLQPAKSLIFTGPPGVGKTITAQWIAQNLGLPLLVLDLAGVMSSYLGKTGNNIKSVIQYAAKEPCVLLLDEFDAIAKRRDDDSDVGELKRLVTVLLQTIDSWPSTSVLIAATNHPELLDSAVWRRFDLEAKFDVPSDDQIDCYLYELTSIREVAILSPFFRGKSYSDIKNTVDRNKKISIIRDLDFIEQLTSDLISDKMNCGMPLEDKKCVVGSLHVLGWSQRKISEQLGISRPTVKRIIEALGSN